LWAQASLGKKTRPHIKKKKALKRKDWECGKVGEFLLALSSNPSTKERKRERERKTEREGEGRKQGRKEGRKQRTNTVM
jgi:hypothetical protein